MNGTTPTTALHLRSSTSQAIEAHHATQHHCGYTPAALRAPRHDQRGQPTMHVQRMLGDGLTPQGVRLAAATLHQLAMDTTGPLAEPPLGARAATPAGQEWIPRTVVPAPADGTPSSTTRSRGDSRHPARVWVWTPDRRAAQTWRDELRFAARVTPNTEVSEHHGDHQGGGRSPPALVGPARG